MKKSLLLLCSLLLLAPATVQAANDKIAIPTYICAELITQPITEGGEPPIFTALQLDGFVSAKLNAPVADAATLPPVLKQVYTECQAKPTEKVVTIWQEVRKKMPTPADGMWRADKTTCKAYADNPDDGSGFVIWLDGYNRGKSDKPASVLNSDADLQAYLNMCSKQPTALMLDIMSKSAR